DAASRTRAQPPCGLRGLGCSPVDLLAAVGALADAHLDLLAVRLLVAHADPRRPVADRTDDHHVPDRERSRLLDHAAGGHPRATHPARVLDRARLRVPLDEIQVLDDHLAVLRARVDDAALLAAVLAAQDVHEVALADAHGVTHQRTSGASETIFMKFFSRSSLATGPKMRVPRGLRCASMITAAFSSNAIDVPSS